MSEPSPRFSPQQIGSSPVRFPSGAPIPHVSDMITNPYAKTLMPKGVQVEGLVFFPQEKAAYPGLILLHERWGLNAQVKEFAIRLACEGYTVLVPNLYVRQGGMVTASVEVADLLQSRLKEADVLQDLTSCCEFLNTLDHVKRNAHGTIGFGMGGTFALRFGCHRRRLRGVVSFYGRMIAPPSLLKDLSCPVLYHRPGADDQVSAQEVERLRQAAQEHDKQVDIRVYEGAPHAFMNDMRPDTYRQDAARDAWAATVSFLAECFKADRATAPAR